ncbi:MAG: DUF3788 domain-containing protein [Tannerella sp.]|jgi:hypothetical protein|nr:DUF3788 domain-containing protein [Tannerella sp.]
MEAELLLREQEVFPSKEVLKNALGEEGYSVFEELEAKLTSGEFAFTLDWNYYRDGKGWLCKVCRKKKTVFWISVWNGFFKAAFYFTEKHLEDIAAMDISEEIKKEFCQTKPVGKLLPLRISVNKQEQLTDLLRITEYKIHL